MVFTTRIGTMLDQRNMLRAFYKIMDSRDPLAHPQAALAMLAVTPTTVAATEAQALHGWRFRGRCGCDLVLVHVFVWFLMEPETMRCYRRNGKCNKMSLVAI